MGQPKLPGTRTFLCLIIDRKTKQQLAEYNVDIQYHQDEWNARHIARERYEHSLRFEPRTLKRALAVATSYSSKQQSYIHNVDWYVDSIDITEC